jgi:intraflagellar transport protein 80
LRTELLKLEQGVYCIDWNSDDDHIVCGSGKMVYIKPLQPGQRELSWKAHDNGCVLKVDWNVQNDMILTSGEDCRYKIWNSDGILLYASQTHDSAITSVGWAPNGEYFCIGSFNMIKLCDKSGWSHIMQEVDKGSIMDVAWNPDSMILAMATAQGQIITGLLIDKKLEWDNWEATVIGDNTIELRNILEDKRTSLNVNERIINVSFQSGYLIVTTLSKCRVYNIEKPNSFSTVDLKGNVIMILQNPKCFCLVDSETGLNIYTYEGKTISKPTIPGLKLDQLNSKKIAISQDVIAVIDSTNPKVLKFFDVANGKSMSLQIEHNNDIKDFDLNCVEIGANRRIAFLDSNKDLFISPVVKKDTKKIISMCNSFKWHESADILTAAADLRIHCWYYPAAIYVDKELMNLCKLVKDEPDIGRDCQIISFYGNNITVKKKDGSQKVVASSPYPQMLLDLCAGNEWDKAIKLCRYIKEEFLWAILASISLGRRHIETAEISLANINSIEKVQFITSLANESPIVRKAELLLYFKKIDEAEELYLSKGMNYRAIKLNLKLYRWDRAVQLVKKLKVHADTVLA